LAGKIVVIGSVESISYFRIIGCDVFDSGGEGLTEEQRSKLKSGEYEIIYVTEESYERYSDLFSGDNGIGSSVTIIPDIRGAVWKDGKPFSTGLPMEQIRRAVIKAVGQDISGPTED
jgi:vacuolar-type H+-ATPase subunit F/Vma7